MPVPSIGAKASPEVAALRMQVVATGKVAASKFLLLAHYMPREGPFISRGNEHCLRM